jgi:hypothetical protein
MIILDGMDNTGKTTLANKLCEALNVPYLHSPSEYRYDRKKMMDWALIEIGSQRSAIYDRFSPITDQVYAPILRGTNPYGDTSRGRFIVDVLKASPHLIIYCRPGTKKILGFEDGRDQMEGVKNNSARLLDRYDNLMTAMKDDGWKIQYYDYDSSRDFYLALRAARLHLNMLEDMRK